MTLSKLGDRDRRAPWLRPQPDRPDAGRLGTTRQTLERIAFALLLFCGAALRLWQYFGRASLWLDELGLAASILTRPLRALIGEPLLFDQVAPPGFLAAVKGSTAVLGDGELALRFFPLACSLVSLLLFVAVARRMLDPGGALFATALFALGVPFIRYASEVKQYSTDVAVGLLLTLTALELPDDGAPARRFWTAGLIGAAAVWFSQSAVFVLLGVGAALAAERLVRAGTRSLGPLLPTFVLWAVAASASVAWSFQRTTPATRAVLRHYWESAFPSPTWWNGFGGLFLANRLRSFWGGSGMRYWLPALFLALSLLGCAALWKARRKSALVLLGPGVVTFCASAAHLYPFDGRLILFLGPALVLAAAAGASLVIALLARARVAPLASAALLSLPALLALARYPPVYRHEETRPLFEQLARRRHPGDAIYVFYGAGQALNYYGPRAGIDPSEATAGGCHRGDLAGYLREIDRFRGRPRVWILIAHSQPRLEEQATIRAYCARIGRRREGMATPEGDRESCTLELFDLSDPERLAATSADTFPLPPVDLKLARRLGCGRGPGGGSAVRTR